MILSRELILKTGLQTLDIESNAIAQLKTCINDEFVNAVQTILKCDGRVVVTGIGKSALVGRKIVATLNSTGTLALFMHAADAIHGDLGMIRQDDIVLCISKSGETAEIKVLIPMLKHFGSTLIGMTSRTESYLARQADHLLHTPIHQEADPNNLAPTASTTAQMAMGDALATALLATRGFSSTDFAQYHPGGTLGKKLYCKVCDIVSKDGRPAVSTADNIRTTIVEMTSKRLGCTVVLDEQEVIQGIITDGDLRRMLNEAGDVEHLKAGDIMTKQPKTIEQSALAVEALKQMKHHSITQLIVTEKGVYAGIIHLHDLFREGIV